MFLIPIVLVQSASAKWYEYLAERCISDANQTTRGSKQRFTLSYAHMGYLRTRQLALSPTETDLTNSNGSPSAS